MSKPIVEISERCYTPGQAAQLLGVNVFTLRTWARVGKIASVKTPGGHRRIPPWVIDQMLGKQSRRASRLRVAIYARVSTKKQAEMGYLVRQKDRLFEYAISKGYDVVASFSEVASGVNEKRRELGKLLTLIFERKI
ncbi:MAG: recombinase family protein, partial [Candidatus Schekmanbacteria bacterium]|nr:recombinase family protein [Candidatus Schekmanbacteria bacterium]